MSVCRPPTSATSATVALSKMRPCHSLANVSVASFDSNFFVGAGNPKMPQILGSPLLTSLTDTPLVMCARLQYLPSAGADRSIGQSWHFLSLRHLVPAEKNVRLRSIIKRL